MVEQDDESQTYQFAALDGSGLGVSGLGLRVEKFGDWGLGLGLRVWGSGCGLKVYGFGAVELGMTPG